MRGFIFCNLFIAIIFWGGIFYKSGNLSNIWFLTDCVSIQRIVTLPFNAVQEMYEYELYKENLYKKAIIKSNDSNIPYFIFILGESMNRNHMELYGYQLKNNPYLKQKENLYVFTDVISPQSGTLQVLKRLFSFYEAENENFYKTTNLFEILHNSGYVTTWISNQDSRNIPGNIGRVYAEACDRQFFTKLKGYDENVIPIIENAIYSEYGNKNFYVIHLMGAHEKYTERYPIQYNVFNDGDNIAMKVRNEYSNAILYNDYIVNQIINMFENKEAILFYISDHGEEVYEDRMFAGHYPNGNFNMIEIPMVVWVSDEFKNKHINLVKNIEASTNKPFVTSKIMHSILDIMKIDVENLDKSKSIFNEEYNLMEKRVYNGKEYNKGWRN